MSHDTLVNRLRRLNAEICSIKKEFALELTFDHDLQAELRSKRNEFNSLKKQFELQYAA